MGEGIMIKDVEPSIPGRQRITGGRKRIAL
jgi:hypothetical protein